MWSLNCIFNFLSAPKNIVWTWFCSRAQFFFYSLVAGPIYQPLVWDFQSGALLLGLSKFQWQHYPIVCNIIPLLYYYSHFLLFNHTFCKASLQLSIPLLLFLSSLGHHPTLENSHKYVANMWVPKKVWALGWSTPEALTKPGSHL